MTDVSKLPEVVPAEVTVMNKSHGGTPNKILPAIRQSQQQHSEEKGTTPKKRGTVTKAREKTTSSVSAPGTGKSLKRVDSRVANAMSGRRKPGIDKADFFSLRKNEDVEYAKSEYYINVYFQRFLSEKIHRYRLAGLEPKKNDSHLPPLTNQASALQLQAEMSSEVKKGRASRLKKGSRMDMNLAINEPNMTLLLPKGILDDDSIAAFTALQRIQTKADLELGASVLNQVQKDFATGFKDAVSVKRTGRTTLYSTVVDNAQTLNHIDKERQLASMQPSGPFDISRASPRFSLQQSATIDERPFRKSVQDRQSIAATSRRGPARPMLQPKLMKSKGWNRAGEIDSSKHLLPFASRAKPYDAARASEVYLPAATRKAFASPKAGQVPLAAASAVISEKSRRSGSKRSSKTKSSKSVASKARSHISGMGSEQEPSAAVRPFLGIPMSVTDADTLGQPSQEIHLTAADVEAKIVTGIPKHAYKERRMSFSMCQTKFGDVHKSFNPLKNAKDTLVDQATIARMKAAKRFPVPEKLLHVPYDWDFTVDSLIHEAYNPDDVEDPEKLSLDAPCNSMESVEQIDFESSDDEAAGMNVNVDTRQRIKDIKLKPLLDALAKQPSTRDELLKETRMKMLKVNKAAFSLHGFDLELLKAYPYGTERGDIPSFLIRVDDPEDHEQTPALIEQVVQAYADDPEDEAYFKQVEKLHVVVGLHEKINEEFSKRQLFPTADHLEYVYGKFCTMFNAKPLSFLQELHDGRLELKGYGLNMAQAKAVACMLPMIRGLETLILFDNGLSDDIAALLTLAAFMNPNLRKLGIEGISNKPKQCTCNTLKALVAIFPKKLEGLSFSGVSEFGIHAARTLTELQNPEVTLRELDLSRQTLSPLICAGVGALLINSKELRTLELLGARLSGYSASIILDGLCRNFGLQSLNLSHNNLSSGQTHECAIKITQVIARHESLMHVDLSMCGLAKEEVIFIGMALAESRSMLALHLSGNMLEYYERIFLRTLLDAKVAAQFRKLANQRGVKNFRPLNKGDMFAGHRGEDFEADLTHFLQAFAFVENLRQTTHDEAFEKLTGIRKLRETEGSEPIDVVGIFDAIRASKRPKATQEETKRGNEARIKLQELVGKLSQLADLVKMERAGTQRFLDEKIRLGEDTILLKDLAKMGLEQKTKDKNAGSGDLDLDLSDRGLVGAPPEKQAESLATKIEHSERYMISGMLKIDRIRQRVQNDALKHIKAKSAGEIALMFQGIGTIAGDVLQENPMVSYMSEVVFSRYLGHDDIEGGDTWRDTPQCYCCERWSKTKLPFRREYVNNMKQDMQRLADLDQVLQKVLAEQNHVNLEPVTPEALKAFEEEQESEEDGFSAITASEDVIRTDSQLTTSQLDADRGDDAPVAREAQGTCISMICPVNFDRQAAQKMLPQNYRIVAPMGEVDHSTVTVDSDEENGRRPRMGEMDLESHNFSQSELEDEDQVIVAPKEAMTAATVGANIGQKASQRNLLNKSTSQDKAIGQRSSPKVLDSPRKSQANKSQRYRKADGKMYKTVTKTLFDHGQRHEIMEEVRVPTEQEDESSGRSTPETSEDEFEVNDLPILQYKSSTRVKLLARDKADKDQLNAMRDLLERNAPKPKSIFGRAQVYLCASFNDWVPVELKSIHELGLQRTKKDGLWQYVSECLKGDASGLRSGREHKNIVQFASYVPPGRHFFYFIHDRKHMCLSREHPMVRYHGTNIFLNEVKVVKRVGLPPVAKAPPKATKVTGHIDGFNRQRSIFKTYQEDDDDFCRKMLQADLKYAKIQRFLARSDGAGSNVLDIFEVHYRKLKNIFMYYAATAKSYPRLSMADFTQFCYKNKLFDRNFQPVGMDKLFVAVNTPMPDRNQFKNPEDRELNRYEFIDILLRIAKCKYAEPKIHPQIDDALEALIVKDIFPVAKSLEGQAFREAEVYNIEVDDFLTRNSDVLRKLWDICCAWTEKNADPAEKNFYGHRLVKKTITGASMQAIRDLMTLAEINIKPLRVNLCYVESMMSKYDAMYDGPVNANRMRFSEFLAFICKVAHEVYVGTQEEQTVAGLHEKLDSLLPQLLKKQGLVAQYSLNQPEKTGLSSEEN